MSDFAGQQPYILGLDLGVASIGWSRVACDPADSFKPLGILGAGSHLFESGTEGTLADIQRGKEEARNVQRRTARLMRRQTWRRARRKRILLKILIRLDLLPAPDALGIKSVGDLKRPLDIDAYLKAFDSKIVARWVALRKLLGSESNPHTDQQRLMYILREASAKGPIDRHEFGRALYHLAQRRGFESNRRADARRSDEDSSKMKAEIGDLAQRIDAFGTAGGVPTLGAYLASLDPDAIRLRGRWTSRAMYKSEFERMWSTQSAAMRLDANAKADVHRAIFHQRPLKNQSDLIGRCSLLPREKRCPVSYRLYQRFRLLQAVNHLTVAEPAASPRALSRAERDAVVHALATHGDLTFAKLRTLLQLKKTTAFNLERGDETRMPGHRTDAKLRAVFGERFDSVTEEDRDRMVDDLRSFRLPEALVRRAIRKWGLAKDEAIEFASIALEEGYAPLSLAALRKLVPRMEEGLPYANARKDEFPDSFESTDPLNTLPPVLKTVDGLRNPAVARTLTETRKLVNEMVRRFGKPALIRVELAREIKNPRKVRERMSRNMRDRERERAAIAARIQSEARIINPKREDIERVLLADECGWVCPYTGRQIGWDSLLGPHPQFDIEHIWPRSRSLDDSLMNKTLCYHEENRSRKRGHTPTEAYGASTERLDEMLGRIRAWKCDPFVKAEKLSRFQADTIPEGFSNRHLSDTRYIARAAADYLGLLFGGRVEAAGVNDLQGVRRVNVSTGGLTAWLRTGWGIDGLLGETAEKNRSDHRHHALDAIVVALSDARAVQCLTRAATEADQRGKRRAFEHVDEPWPGFRDDADRILASVVVSHRQSRKVAGPLHDQSIYSRPIGGQVGSHRIRKELFKLTPSEIRDGKIVDARALEAIRAVVKEKLGTDNPKPQDLTKLFADPSNAPLVKGHAGKLVRLRKVRVEAKADRKIGRDDKATGRWVNPKNNHHTIIVETRNAKGQVKWEDRPVALIDVYAGQAEQQAAYLRLRRPECKLDQRDADASRLAAREHPIVDRRVGKGERFLFSLAPGEYVEMDTPGDPTKRAVYRLVSISAGDNELKLHMDGRTADELKKAKSRVRASGDKLRQWGARKVHVTYLGQIMNAGG